MIQYFKIKNKIMGLGAPKVCVPIVGRTKEDIIAQARDIVEVAKSSNIDMAEFRGDFYEDLSDYKKLADTLKELGEIFTDIILLFTIRSEQEGGEKLKEGTPAVNTINKYVIENALADMVDIELYSGAEEIGECIELAKDKGVKIIMSNHDFEKTPDANEIVNRLRLMQDMGADVAKIAVMPQNKMALLALLAATVTMQENYATVPIVTISMGKLGVISRMAGEVFGSAMTFASLKEASAPGQVPVKDLNEIMGLISRYSID